MCFHTHIFLHLERMILWVCWYPCLRLFRLFLCQDVAGDKDCEAAAEGEEDEGDEGEMWLPSTQIG